MFIAISLPLGARAEILKFVSARDGHTYEARITSNNQINSVSFYEDEKPLGSYDNLIVNESSLSSSLVSVVGYGIALKIESEGSRTKYEILAPIEFVDGNLYVECLYKNTYDSVEETRAVGAICQRQELHQFDVSSSINTANLNIYTVNHDWLKSLSPGSCASAVGVEASSYRIARCAPEGASETSKQKIVVLDQHNRQLFSIAGYEFIPLKNSSKFFLMANLKDDAVLFKGDFSCYSIGSIVSDATSGTAMIHGIYEINYSISTAGICLNGTYSYTKRNRKITLEGNVENGMYYLLEMGSDRISSGAFMLNGIGNGIKGFWVGVPPKGPFSVY
ncbi:hypothetical protein [Burkholderia cepacia]|uniref:hypothetical protein n=1 Tax=Burkholderia cepacia TaxID=292 RepID=UPI0012D49E29|nr:hypothetical protein [Burkholderia cepacia]